MSKKRQDNLPLTSISPIGGGSCSSSSITKPGAMKDEIITSGSSIATNDQLEEEDDDDKIPLSRYLIVASRVFVLLGIVIFNIAYWTIYLSLY